MGCLTESPSPSNAPTKPSGFSFLVSDEGDDSAQSSNSGERDTETTTDSSTPSTSSTDSASTASPSTSGESDESSSQQKTESSTATEADGEEAASTSLEELEKRVEEQQAKTDAEEAKKEVDSAKAEKADDTSNLEDLELSPKGAQEWTLKSVRKQFEDGIASSCAKLKEEEAEEFSLEDAVGNATERAQKETRCLFEGVKICWDHPQEKLRRFGCMIDFAYDPKDDFKDLYEEPRLVFWDEVCHCNRPVEVPPWLQTVMPGLQSLLVKFWRPYECVKYLPNVEEIPGYKGQGTLPVNIGKCRVSVLFIFSMLLLLVVLGIVVRCIFWLRERWVQGGLRFPWARTTKTMEEGVQGEDQLLEGEEGQQGENGEKKGEEADEYETFAVSSDVFMDVDDDYTKTI
uniref:Uncharacterized protein n=1 Tax=Chromera velia CCMP2878 TaxID=1169474 RepID=A0A0G4HAQ1_9ALVE|eukprot:Cvel_6131.t1-p1 / transcript=Cvel_6131.t1 / gene=Cvel_6131 / organism=Chromera_velia_CCMP2878 / gene_product=hypothetical protein / transcript_product=hypothetical protein / location=Cvel_scaffold296:43312-46025(+) / protein_length=401 / sequence_SO=supercontig / SO=protein_coding / is_pseudo=false